MGTWIYMHVHAYTSAHKCTLVCMYSRLATDLAWFVPCSFMQAWVHAYTCMYMHTQVPTSAHLCACIHGWLQIWHDLFYVSLVHAYTCMLFCMIVSIHTYMFTYLRSAAYFLWLLNLACMEAWVHARTYTNVWRVARGFWDVCLG